MLKKSTRHAKRYVSEETGNKNTSCENRTLKCARKQQTSDASARQLVGKYCNKGGKRRKFRITVTGQVEKRVEDVEALGISSLNKFVGVHFSDLRSVDTQ